MKKVFLFSLCLISALAFVTSTGLAGKSDPVIDQSNGFPSGPHYNLNIIGKKDVFTCPDPVFVDGVQVYGNVVFVPETGEAQILMESGSTKGKTAASFTELRAIDPCATDGTAAKIQLPPNANGYRVYARALATPTDNPLTPTMAFTGGGIPFVQDENQTDLAYIGLVTPSGFETPYAFTRVKGKPVTLPISDMFMWAGTVCYESPPVYEFGNSLPEYPATPMCWVDKSINADGTISDVPDSTYGYPDSISLPVNGGCTEGVLRSDATSLYCHTYEEEQWVFNIADLVQYFWGMETNGSKLLQIRFYPN